MPLGNSKSIAILGGGPSGLFMFKRLIEAGEPNFHVTIFEKKTKLGCGMPYSEEGANEEHITNVSGNEMPELLSSIADWMETVPEATLKRFRIKPGRFNEYKVLPRLLFGQYLSDQFALLRQRANELGISTHVYLGTEVSNMIDDPQQRKVSVETTAKQSFEFDHVVICTGHRWPIKHEGKIPGYFDSPYPPAKLSLKINHAVAIKGSSLTAIDAIRTLARHNGEFKRDEHDKISYVLHQSSAGFKLLMHSRSGLLPAIRFHLEDPRVLKSAILSPEEVRKNRLENKGFLSLDYVFEKNFKQLFKPKHPELYVQIKDMGIEEFVSSMKGFREKIAPFQLFKAEYAEAEKSIKLHESVYWKEMLAVLSFTMNYPAKYFSAEDMQRLQKVLMPLISIVIAFVPQASVEEMLALYEAGLLDIVAVGNDSRTEPIENGGVLYHYMDEHNQLNTKHYRTFVDCVGQPHLSYDDFPFQGLLKHKTISPARLKFRSSKIGLDLMNAKHEQIETDDQGNYYLKVPGITINDHFQVVDAAGETNERIYIMAVPYIGGYNPDYSGLDFCETASATIAKQVLC